MSVLYLQGLYKKKYTIVEPAAEVEDIAQPDTATRSGVSLYIVIAIIGWFIIHLKKKLFLSKKFEGLS